MGYRATKLIHFFAPGLGRNITPSEAEVRACQCFRALSLHTRGQFNIFWFRMASKHTFLTCAHQLIYHTRCQPDFLPSVTQCCQYLGICIIYLAGSSTPEIPSHWAVNVLVRSPLKHRETIKNYQWKAKKTPRLFLLFSVRFLYAADYCSNVNMIVNTNMKPRGEWKLSLGENFCCKSACLPCTWCKGSYWCVHPAEQGDASGISVGRRFLKVKVKLLVPKGSVTLLVSTKPFASVPGPELRVGKIQRKPWLWRCLREM